jgi:hypothetical protein
MKLGDSLDDLDGLEDADDLEDAEHLDDPQDFAVARGVVDRILRLRLQGGALHALLRQQGEMGAMTVSGGLR